MANTMDPFECVKNGDADYFKRVELDVIQKARDKDGFSVLAMAAWYGHLSCCEVIYRRCPELLYEKINNGGTPLHQAAWNGNGEIIQFLLTAKVKLEQEVKGIKSGGGKEEIDFSQLTMLTNFKSTALHSAATRGHTLSAKLLIGADPSNELLEMADENKDTAMHLAVRYLHLEIVKLLLKADPDFEYSANTSEKTPLLIAWEKALSGDQKAAEIRKLLIEKQPAQCRLPTAINGWTLIHHATYSGDLSTVKEIIHFWPDCCNLVDKEEQNFLHLAAKLEQVNVVRYILDLTNLAENVLNRKDVFGNTPLHLAIRSGNQEIAISLLNDPRANKMAENLKGKKALDLASSEFLGALIKDKYPIQCARKGDVDFFRSIQVDVLRKSTDEDGESVLSTAVRNGRLKCCEVISKICPELLYQTDKNGFSTLHTAASNGKDELIIFLLGALGKMDHQGAQNSGIGGGRDIIDYKLLTMVTNNQQTALHIAVDKGHIQSAKLLILSDPNNKLLRMVDNKNETAMHYAVKMHNLEIVKLLLEADPDVDYPANESGHTPLFMALQEALSGDQITGEQKTA